MIKNILINNLNISYWFRDNHQENTTLFIHGLCGDHRGLMDCASYLKNNNLIILDLPGYGLSEPLKTKHNLEGYANFILAFIDKLNLNKINLVGHSFGASVVLKFFDKYPERIKKLILISPVISDNKTLSYRIGKMFFKFAGLFNDRIFRSLVCNKFIVYISDIAVMQKDAKSVRKKILKEDYQNYKKANPRTIRESFYAVDKEGFKLTNPNNINILALIGKKDILSSQNNRDIISKIANIKVLLKDGGHLISQENPELVGDILVKFIA